MFNRLVILAAAAACVASGAYAQKPSLAGPPPVAVAPNTPITPVACKSGSPILAEYDGQWWNATVNGAPSAKGLCPIAYDGYDASWNEAVEPARMRARLPEQAGPPPVAVEEGAAQRAATCVVGSRILVDWQGQWWNATVRGPLDAKGLCPIAYDGYDASWDESVEASRMRARP